MEALPGMMCDLDSSSLANAMVNASEMPRETWGYLMLDAALCWVGFDRSCVEEEREGAVG
jgi:hypothetical protein